MKRMFVLAVALVLAVAVAAVAGEEKQTAGKAEKGQATAAVAKEEARSVTLTGEVLDLYCYMSHPESATGEGHAKCANACIAKGLPVGFLTADGTVYVIVGSDHSPANDMVKDWVGKQSTITGKLMQHKGMKAIDIAAISEAKS